MGHDIYAHKITPAVCDMRRSAFDPRRKCIYEALDVLPLYGDVSGIGYCAMINMEKLILAKEFIQSWEEGLGYDLREERKFLEVCIQQCEGDGALVIRFN